MQQRKISEREQSRRDKQRKSPPASKRPVFLNEDTPAPAADAVDLQSAGARNVLLDARPPPNKRYLTAAQLRARWGGVSHMFIERRLKNDPSFPRPVKIGDSLLRLWDVDQLEAYERACTMRGTRRSSANRGRRLLESAATKLTKVETLLTKSRRRR